jgi:acyl carrier protein
MIDREKLINTLYKAIDEVNSILEGDKICKSMDTSLYGDLGVLDSLGLINLLAAIEEQIEKDFGITLLLLDDIDLSEDTNDFCTVSTLFEYIFLRLSSQEG